MKYTIWGWGTVNNLFDNSECHNQWFSLSNFSNKSNKRFMSLALNERRRAMFDAGAGAWTVVMMSQRGTGRQSGRRGQSVTIFFSASGLTYWNKEKNSFSASFFTWR